MAGAMALARQAAPRVIALLVILAGHLGRDLGPARARVRGCGGRCTRRRRSADRGGDPALRGRPVRRSGKVARGARRRASRDSEPAAQAGPLLLLPPPARTGAGPSARIPGQRVRRLRAGPRRRRTLDRRDGGPARAHRRTGGAGAEIRTARVAVCRGGATGAFSPTQFSPRSPRPALRGVAIPGSGSGLDDDVQLPFRDARRRPPVQERLLEF